MAAQLSPVSTNFELRADMLCTLPEDHSAQEIAHYIRRAREERELAIKAISSGASDAHLQRAMRYETLVARAHNLEHEFPGAADYEISNFTKSSQKFSPFHQRQTLRHSFL